MDPVPGGSFQPGEHLAGGFVNSAVSCTCECSAGSKGDARDACPPGAQILSISCSFWENLAKTYVGAPGELAPPPRGNPGSATGMDQSLRQKPTKGLKRKIYRPNDLFEFMFLEAKKKNKTRRCPLQRKVRNTFGANYM